MQKPGIITQRLTLQDNDTDEHEHDDDNEAASVLEEVLIDLQTLSGAQLYERITQRKVLLHDILDASNDPEERKTIERMLSAYAQYQFLQEHLHSYEIVGVLLAVEPDHPFLLRHFNKNHLGDQDNPYQGAHWGNYMCVKDLLKPQERANFLLSIIAHLQEKLSEDKKVINISGERSAEHDMTQLYLARTYELFAQTIQKTRNTDRYMIASSAYALAYKAWEDTMFLQGFSDVDVLFNHAKALWNGGNLIGAANTYISISDSMIDYKLQEDNEEDIHVLDQYHLRAAICYLQILLEEQQQLSAEEKTPENIEDLFDTYTIIKEEIMALYDILIDKGYIQKNKEDACYLACQRRFVYGRYLRQTEQYVLAQREFSLIDKEIAGDIIDAITKLQKTGTLTFIKTPHKTQKTKVRHI